MKLTIQFTAFLTDEKASVRLFNMLSKVRWQDGAGGLLTVSQFIDQWPLERLRNEVFGFGPKAQAELFEIMSRHHTCNSSKKFDRYVNSLHQLDCSPEHLRKLPLLRLLQQLVAVTKNTQSTQLKNLITELKKRPIPSVVTLKTHPVQWAKIAKDACYIVGKDNLANFEMLADRIQKEGQIQ